MKVEEDSEGIKAANPSRDSRIGEIKDMISNIYVENRPNRFVGARTRSVVSQLSLYICI